MKKMRFLICFVILSILLTIPLSVLAEMKLGVFPRRSALITHKAFTPLAKKLSLELGENVELVLAKDFKSFWKSVKNNEFDIVHYTQYHYVQAHKELGHTLLVANEEFGKRTLAGSIFVRKDSGINELSDLKGKKILFGGGKKAMGAYIAPMSILKKNGLENEKDFASNFAKSGPNAVLALYHKQTDAACAGNVVMSIKSATQKIDKDQIKTLAESSPFPQLPWVATKGMPADKIKTIQKTMTSLQQTDEGKEILKAAGVTSYFEVTDSDYDSVRVMVMDVLGEQY